jgi:ABC-type Fe3+-hydroxamate transport system substrate-binding protein
MLYYDYKPPFPAFSQPPRRVVSLCPSLTETIFALGAADRLVGRTKFCVRPPGQLLNDTPKVGGTKTVNVQAVLALRPDCVFAVKEENLSEHIEEIAKHTDVVVFDVKDLESAYGMIRSLQKILNVEDTLDEFIREKMEEVRNLVSGRAACLIWRKPLLAAGGDTYIHSLMTHLGFENAFAHKPRYPEAAPAELKKLDYILLSTEPYPFKDVHAHEIEEKVGKVRIVLVDGQMMTWYGARMAAAASYFKTWADEIKAQN